MKTVHWNKDNPFWLALLLVAPGAMAGLAALLRSEQRLTRRAVLSALLNSAIFTFAIAAIMHWQLGDDKALFIAGWSLLAGLGGNTVLGLIIKIVPEILRGFIRVDSRTPSQQEWEDEDA